MTRDTGQKPAQTYRQLLTSIRKIPNHYEQVAQLSSSHDIVRSSFRLTHD